jgi:hypothetical protein
VTCSNGSIILAGTVAFDGLKGRFDSKFQGIPLLVRVRLAVPYRVVNSPDYGLRL